MFEGCYCVHAPVYIVYITLLKKKFTKKFYKDKDSLFQVPFTLHRLQMYPKLSNHSIFSFL